MARVKELFRDQRSSSAHPTEVECGWQIVMTAEGSRLLQLSTYGSDDRQSEKKVSQTVQIDRAVARRLVQIMTETFDL
jgi:hypothetical protein